MNLLGIYTVGVAQSLCRRLLLWHSRSNRILSIVMALSTTFTQCARKLPNSVTKITQN